MLLVSFNNSPYTLEQRRASFASSETALKSLKILEGHKRSSTDAKGCHKRDGQIFFGFYFGLSRCVKVKFGKQEALGNKSFVFPLLQSYSQLHCWILSEQFQGIKKRCKWDTGMLIYRQHISLPNHQRCCILGNWHIQLHLENNGQKWSWTSQIWYLRILWHVMISTLGCSFECSFVSMVVETKCLFN